ncbi:hypothetical protein GN956_G4698 [Arapaima gigas]
MTSQRAMGLLSGATRPQRDTKLPCNENVTLRAHALFRPFSFITHGRRSHKEMGNAIQSMEGVLLLPVRIQREPT